MNKVAKICKYTVGLNSMLKQITTQLMALRSRQNSIKSTFVDCGCTHTDTRFKIFFIRYHSHWPIPIIICLIAIAYSMGQIMKSVCVCLCVRRRALSRSHFLIDFHKNWHRHKKPKRKNEIVRGSISHHSFYYFVPPNPYFRPKGPENPCKC